MKKQIFLRRKKNAEFKTPEINKFSDENQFLIKQKSNRFRPSTRICRVIQTDFLFLVSQYCVFFGSQYRKKAAAVFICTFSDSYVFHTMAYISIY